MVTVLCTLYENLSIFGVVRVPINSLGNVTIYTNFPNKCVQNWTCKTDPHILDF